MQGLYFYKQILLIPSILCLFFVSQVNTQTEIFEFKLQLEDDDTWGVYVKTDQSVTFSNNVQFSNSQVTIVAPTGFQFTNLSNQAGFWSNNATNVTPTENLISDYISFGSLPGSDIEVPDDGTEVLLFTIDRVGLCPDTLYLIDNDTDPFNMLPNSAGNNPGNNFDFIDIGNGFEQYDYKQNYSFSAWSCEDCDGDGILNGLEDTNGDGIYTMGVDTSALCDICDPIHPDTAYLSLAVNADSVICAGDLTDAITFVVDITGGWPPYTVEYTDGNATYIENNYTSGDDITYTPTDSGTLELVSVTDNEGCVAGIGDLLGNFDIIVEGPITFDSEPIAISECSGNSVLFTSAATNSGDGDLFFQWQISTDNGSNFYDIVDGTPYSAAATNELEISDIAGLNANQYRVKIYTISCDTVFSVTATLTVEGPLAITLDPDDDAICAGEDVTFNSGAANAGQGGLNSVWQVSTDNGTTFIDLSDGGVYADVATSDLAMTAVDNSYHGYQYRLKTWTTNCDSLFSFPARLTVEGPLSIITQPADVASCSGNPVTFWIAYDNGVAGDVNFQWQYDDQVNGWQNLQNNDIFNGVTTDSLSIGDVIGLDNYEFQVIISTAECSSLTSGSAQLTIDGPILYTTQPQDVAICYDDVAIFMATATIGQGTITYQWQTSTDGLTFNDISDGLVYSGTASGTLTVNDLTGLDGNYYQVLAQTDNCDDVPSLVAELQVEGPFNIAAGQEPADRTVCDGNPASFSAIVNNDNSGIFVYQWQVKIGASNWLDLNNNSIYSGANSDFLGISNTSGLNGNQYRLCVTTQNCTANPFYTNPAILTVEGPITFSDHPDPVTLCAGVGTTFSATPVNGSGEGTMVLQWQLSSDGINYFDLSEGQNGIYHNVNSTTLTIDDVSGLYSRCYRLQVTTSECLEVNSDEACLTVEGPVSFDAEPIAVTQCDSEAALFYVDVDNTGDGDVTYQWQINSNGIDWNNITNGDIYNGATTDTLSISNVAGLGGNEYQVIISAGTCGEDISVSAALTVEGPLSYTTQPQDVTQCAGTGTSFDVTIFNAGAGGQADIQWQFSDNGGAWTDVPDVGGDAFGDPTSSTLVITDVTGLQGYSFRTISSTTTCNGLISNEATLTVEGPIDFTLTGDPDDITTCHGSGASFTVETSNTGQGAIMYQWQFRVDDSNPWFNLSNSSLYNGVTTSNLSISAVDVTMHGYQYQCIIQTSTCSSNISGFATLFIEGPISFDAIPEDVTSCTGLPATFSVAVNNGNGGTATIQWQVSTDGINYGDVPDNAIYDDVTTNTLTINDVDGLHGRCYRAAVITTTCAPFYSDPGCLTVEGPLNVVSQPTPSTICSDLGTTFVIEVENQGEGFIFYQWQENDGSGWANLTNTPNINGVATDTLSIDQGIGLNGNLYRVVVSTESCISFNSTEVALTIDGPISIDNHPDDVLICDGTDTSFSVVVSNATAANGVPIIYQWQFSSNAGATWNNVVDDGILYTNATTATLNITGTPASLTGYKYKCLVSTANCAIQESESANLFVEGPINFTDPVAASVCSNVGHIFNATVANGGAGVLSLQWQVNDGSGWADLSNTGVYGGTMSQDLFIDLTDGLDGYIYRLKVTTLTCEEYSAEVILTVRDACADGTCDFDLDGQDNDTDDDDDNDGLDDFWEDYITMNSLATVGVQHTMNNCDPDSDGDGITDDQEDPDMDSINNGEETDGDTVFDGDPLDPCDPILSSACIGIELDLRVYLQGAMMGSPDTLMRDDLRALDYIPAIEPYADMAHFEHEGNGGGETITNPATVFGVTGKDAIVDWVFIELRSAIKLDSIIATRSALVQRDGDVVDVDGNSNLFFNGIVAGEYFVAIRHRNHLGVMTNDAGALSPIPTVIDFTKTNIDWHGTNSMYEKDGRLMLWAGDFNNDKVVIYQGPDNDITDLFIQVLADDDNNISDPDANFISYGYYTTDIDLDGDSVYQGPDNDRSIMLFQVILPFPGNGSFLENWAIFEQLP